MPTLTHYFSSLAAWAEKPRVWSKASFPRSSELLELRSHQLAQNDHRDGEAAQYQVIICEALRFRAFVA